MQHSGKCSQTKTYEDAHCQHLCGRQGDAGCRMMRRPGYRTGNRIGRILASRAFGGRRRYHIASQSGLSGKAPGRLPSRPPCPHATLRLDRKVPMRSSAFKMFSVELA
jgi:hypothetical protein